jgi:hypothetical protein
MAARPRRDPTDDWEQLRLLVTSPAQEAYETLRPIVLFGQPTAERAQETGTAERTLRRAVALFETAGCPLGDALSLRPRAAIVPLRSTVVAGRDPGRDSRAQGGGPRPSGRTRSRASAGSASTVR